MRPTLREGSALVEADAPAPAAGSPRSAPPGIAALLPPAPPPRFVEHASEAVGALGAGEPGKLGWADVTASGVGGRTALTRAEARVPYQVGRLHHRDDLPHGLATLYLTMPTGGLVQGDRLAVRVIAEQGARLRLTTPAATKVYGMRANYAAQAVHLSARSGALLVWRPEPTIPYRHARYHQATTLVVAPGAALVWIETLLPGRVAHGERHAYDWLALAVEARLDDGALLAAERQEFAPAHGPLAAPGRLRDRPVLVNAYILAPDRPLVKLLPALAATVETWPDALAGVSLLDGAAGIVVRGLAATGGAALALADAVETASVRFLSEFDAVAE